MPAAAPPALPREAFAELMQSVSTPRPPPAGSKSARLVERPHTDRPMMDRPSTGATERFGSERASSDPRPHTDRPQARDRDRTAREKGANNVKGMLEERRKNALDALNIPRPTTLAEIPGLQEALGQPQFKVANRVYSRSIREMNANPVPPSHPYPFSPRKRALTARPAQRKQPWNESTHLGDEIWPSQMIKKSATNLREENHRDLLTKTAMAQAQHEMQFMVGPAEEKLLATERFGSTSLRSSPGTRQPLPQGGAADWGSWGPPLRDSAAAENQSPEELEVAARSQQMQGSQPPSAPATRDGGGLEPEDRDRTARLNPKRAERGIVTRWLQLASSTLREILDKAEHELSAMLEDDAHDPEHDPSKSFVEIHVIDPRADAAQLDDKGLALPSSWLAKREGAQYAPDPFTLKTARAKTTLRPTVKRSELRQDKEDQEKPFASLYLPLLPPKSAADVGAHMLGRIGRGNASKIQEVAPGEAPVLGVVALTRDGEDPFTHWEETQLVWFCELLAMTLDFHLRMQRAEERTRTAKRLRNAAVAMAGERDVGALARRAGRHAAAMVGAESARVLLLSGDGTSAVAYSPDGDSEDWKEGRLEPALETVVRSCAVLNVADASEDARFQPSRVRRAQARTPRAGGAEAARQQSPGKGKGRGAQEAVLPRSAGVVANEAGLAEDGLRGEGRLLRRTAGGGLEPAVVAPNVVCVPIVDQVGEGGQPIVRGVMQCMNKRTGPFDHVDVKCLSKLCGVFARSLGHALCHEAVQQAQQDDLVLLASWDLPRVVAATLDKVKRDANGTVACFYAPTENKHALVAYGVPEAQGHQVAADEEKGFAVGSCYVSQKVVRVSDHAAGKGPTKGTVPRPNEYWRQVRNSLCVPVENPVHKGEVLGVIHVGNKQDALERGFSDVDAAKVAHIAHKVGHALLSINRLHQAELDSQSERELAKCCMSMISAASAAEVVRMVGFSTPQAVGSSSVTLLLGGEGNLAFWTLSDRSDADQGSPRGSSLSSYGRLQTDSLGARRSASDNDRKRRQMLYATAFVHEFASLERSGGLWLNPDVADHAAWQQEFYSATGKDPARWSFLLPIREGLGVRGVLQMEWTDEGSQPTVSAEKLQIVCDAVLSALRGIEQQRSLYETIDTEKARVEQHREMERLATTMAARTSVLEIKTDAQSICKSLIKVGRADFYSLSEDGKHLVWHNADLAATRNVSASPDLVLDLRGIVGHCCLAKQCLNVQNATASPHFDPQVDQRSDRYRPRDILCVPIMQQIGSQSESVLGVLQVTNKLDGAAFNEADEIIVGQLAVLTATCLENIRRRERQELLVGSLCRVCNTLEVPEILREAVKAADDCCEDKFSSIKIWLRDRRFQSCLLLVASQIRGKEAWVTTHMPPTTLARKRKPVSRDQPDAQVRSTFKLGEKSHLRADKEQVEAVCLPIRAFNHANVEVRDEVIGVLQLACVRGRSELTAHDTSLLAAVARQCGAGLSNAEAHDDTRVSAASSILLFNRAEAIFKCKSTLELFQKVCQCAEEVVNADSITIFGVDPSGRHVRDEYSSAGALTHSKSQGYKLKNRVAFMVVQSMNDVPSFVAEDLVDEGPGVDAVVTLKHCTGTALWQSGATEKIKNSSGDGVSPLYGVLVCIRSEENGAFSANEVAPLHSLCQMAADQMHHIKQRALHIGAQFVKTATAHVQQELAAAFGDNLGQAMLTHAEERPKKPPRRRSSVVDLMQEYEANKSEASRPSTSSSEQPRDLKERRPPPAQKGGRFFEDSPPPGDAGAAAAAGSHLEVGARQTLQQAVQPEEVPRTPLGSDSRPASGRTGDLDRTGDYADDFED